jgi:hypothetical protein
MSLYARCYPHRDAATMPRRCQTCRRIADERRIVRATVDALLSAGMALFVDGQGDENRPAAPTTDRAAILAELMEMDDEFLIAVRPTDAPGTGRFVRFVYGNDGFDVISDYTVSLEDAIRPALTLANRIEARG